MTHEIIKAKVAFEKEWAGYLFRATYLEAPKGDALIEIEKEGRVVRSILWPAYKIWNIAAHAEDIASELDAGSDAGLLSRLANQTF